MLTQASKLIHRGSDDRPEWTELAAMIVGFHSCHMMAMLDELAGALRLAGHTPATVQLCILAYDVDQALS